MKISELMDSYWDDTVEIRGQHRGQSGGGAPEDPADGKKRPGGKTPGPPGGCWEYCWRRPLAVCAVAGGAVASVNHVRAADLLGRLIQREEREDPSPRRKSNGWRTSAPPQTLRAGGGCCPASPATAPP